MSRLNELEPINLQFVGLGLHPLWFGADAFTKNNFGNCQCATTPEPFLPYGCTYAAAGTVASCLACTSLLTCRASMAAMKVVVTTT